LRARKIEFLNSVKKQVHVYYTGRVQGVGFRFTTQDLAQDLRVAGWVRNLRDGRVELMAEAREDALKDFLSRIYQYFSSYIQDVDINWQEAGNEFADFQIRF
jgi:acylphosphatase